MNEAKKIKLSGYIQAQYMNTSIDGAKTFSGANFPANSHNIFKLRRGRVKLDYKSDIVGYTMQAEATEGGITLKDAYIDVKEPFAHFFTLRAGIFKPAMDNELLYGADSRYCMEAAKIIQTLFPGEYELGAMVIVQAPKKYFISPITLQVGLLTGTAATAENDDQKNITARLLYDNSWEDFRFVIGASTYQGGVYQSSPEVYTMEDAKFVRDSSSANIGKQGKRNYYAGELQFHYKSPIGRTSLTGEYWRGEQSGTITSSNSPNSTLPIGPTYIRPFQGAIAMLSHEIINTNIALALKYDFYDPNTNVSGYEIGLNGTGAADLTYSTVGCGLIYSPSYNLRFTLWYDILSNETSYNLHGYQEDLRDNAVTLRMQVRF
jgi:hypothetical protein